MNSTGLTQTLGTTALDSEHRLPDLTSIPPILVLPAHFRNNEEHELEEKLREHGAPLTSDLSKVKVFIGNVGTKRRAEFELRSRKFRVEEFVENAVIASPPKDEEPPNNLKRKKDEGLPHKPIQIDDDGSTTETETETEDDEVPAAKKRKIGGSSTTAVEDEGSATEDDETRKSVVSETEDELDVLEQKAAEDKEDEIDREIAVANKIFENTTDDDIVWIIKVGWLNRCIESGHVLPLADDLVYKGKVTDRPQPPIQKHVPSSAVPHKMTATSASRRVMAAPPPPVRSIIERAKADAALAPPSRYVPHGHQAGPSHGSHRFDGKTYTSSAQQAAQTASQTAHLLQQTTSEYEGTDSEIPEPPEWVKNGIKYSCQRFTPAHCPNQDFIDLLKQIRTARTLIDDDVGVRAYSTIIASIQAYPYKISHPRELLRLPGCELKVANLWVEWKNTNMLQAVEDFENDEVMKVLREFYNIWGVGAKTARAFFYNNHWRELDDIIEYGWNDLDRVQQIGVKYYDEFLDGIPRDECERIAEVVRSHAVKLRDERITCTIVGGYRRGKELSGDVDMVVSHPDLEATAGLVQELGQALEDEGWITHTLIMSLNNTNRGQQTLPFRTTKQSGSGFDTLDKALVVWQDPNWPTRDEDLAANPKAKNPNIHRRVDIIIAPWRTVGCAVMGWSGGTTFQRDLRRYAKHIKGWKFDSSGIRSRETGEIVELEGPDGVDGTPEDAEKKVFEGLGLEFVPPTMRCTQ